MELDSFMQEALKLGHSGPVADGRKNEALFEHA